MADRPGSSQYTGVSWSAAAQKWRSQYYGALHPGGPRKAVHGRCTDSEEEAAKEYDM